MLHSRMCVVYAWTPVLCTGVFSGGTWPSQRVHSVTETNMEQMIRMKLNSRGILQWWGEKGWINNYIITKQLDIWFMVWMNEFLKGMSPFPRWGVKRNQLVKSTSSKESTLWHINNWPSGLRYCGGTQSPKFFFRLRRPWNAFMILT